MPMTTYRNTRFLLIFFFALLLTLGSFVLQFGFGLQPCSLCMVARSLVIAITVLFGLALVHEPKGLGVCVYRALGCILALLGILVTVRHLWILHSPLSATPDCIPKIDYLLEILPLKDALMIALKGSHECSEDTTQFLGLPLPGWTLLGFAMIVLMTVLPWGWIQRRFEKHGK